MSADTTGVQLTPADSPGRESRAQGRYPKPLPTAFTKEGDGGASPKSNTEKLNARSLSLVSELSDLDSESGRSNVGRRRRPRLERRMSTIDVLYQMQNLQLDEEEEDGCRCCDHSSDAKSIHPHSTFRTRWDLAISIMLVYNAFTIPYRVCFGDVLSTSHGLWYLDRFIDVFFIIDVVANFHTGYVRSTDGQVELSRKLVRWNYLKTWFAIDFISSVPYEVIVMIVVDSEDPRQYSDSPQLLRTTKALKISRYIRFLKVVKVLRLVRAVHIFKRFEKVSDDYCNLKSAHPLRFGDANYAAPAVGRIYALVAMAIGACVFSYGVTHVITLMSSLNKQEQAFREKMDRIATYMSFRNLPSSLRSDVREFFHYTHSTKTEKRMLEVEKEILSEMSPSLAHEVVLFVNRQIVDKVAFLRDVDHRFFQRIVRNLESATFAPNELVMKEGEIGKKLFIISKGVVELLKTDNMLRIETRADG
eukprot:g704.t1